MAGLGDVGDTSSITTGQVLQWSGTEFIPVTLPTQVVDSNGNITINLTPITDALAAIHSKMGVGSMETHLGGLPGNILPDDSNIKSIFTAIENEIETLKSEIVADDIEIEAVEQDLNSLNTNFNTLQNNFTTLVATVDSEDLALKARLDTLEAAGYISGVPAEYVTETELVAEGFLKIADLSGFATETYVTNAIADIPAPDLSSYATTAYVDGEIAGLTLGGLSDVFSTTANNGDVLKWNTATSSWVPQPDVDTTVDLTGYATENYVDAEIAGLTIAGIAGISGTPGVNQIVKWDGNSWTFASDVDTDTTVDLTGYATENYVNTQISGISTELTDLADVFTSGVANGEVLTYNAATSSWVPQSVSSGSSTLSGLTDVNLGGSITTGHVLKYDGSNWVSGPESGGGGGGISLSDLSVTNNPTSGGSGSLSYNPTSGIFTFSQPSPTDASDFLWNASLVPQVNNTYDIGSSSNAVRDIYLDNSIKFGSGDLSIAGGKVTFAGDDLATESWVQSQSYLTAYTETDTLDSVTDRGNSTTNDIYVNKVYFSNVFSALGDLPNASTYHGMFAHVHATGAAYFAHGGNWVELANKSDIGSSSFAITDLTDVDSAAPQNDDILVYSTADSEFKFENLTSVVSSLSLQNIADAGYGVDVTGKIATTDGIDIDIGGSINAAGTSVDFQNTTISFTGANIGGLSPSDVNLDNLTNQVYGVTVTGKVETEGVDIAIGGSINAAGTSIDFQNTTISFTGASVGGLGSTIRDATDLHLNKSVATDGQVLSWDTSANAGNGDYTWITPATGGGGGSTTLAALTDVSTSGATTGEILEYNGTNWATSDALTELQEFQNNIVNATTAANLSFTSNNLSGSSPLSVSLDIDVSGYPNQFVVDWGDGNSDTYSSQFGISHTYNQPTGGLNTISVTAKNTNGTGFGSTSTQERVDYITLYTPQPVPGFAFYNTQSGGSSLSGNNLYAIEGQSIYLDNNTTNTIGATCSYEVNWGDSTFALVPTNSDPGGVEGTRIAQTYGSNSGTGRFTVQLDLETHNTADPSVIPSQAGQFLKVYAANPSTPAKFSNSGISISGGTSVKLAINSADRTGGNSPSDGSIVNMLTGTATANTNRLIYAPAGGLVTALISGGASGTINNDGASTGDSDQSLSITGTSDYQLYTSGGYTTSFNNSIYYPGLHTGHNYRVSTSTSNINSGYNDFQLIDGSGNNSNVVGFAVDDFEQSPTLDVSAATLTELSSGTYRYISGIPHYNTGSPQLSLANVKGRYFVGQVYRTSENDVISIQNGDRYESTGANVVNTNNYSYQQMGMKSGGVVIGGLGTVAPYTLSTMTIPISTSSNRGVSTIKLRARNVHGTSSFSTINTTKVQFHTASQNGVREDNLSVATNLGNGAFTDGGVRVFDFAPYAVDTPAISSSTNYYNNSVYSELADPGVAGTQEATIRFGVLKHDTSNWSTGYLPPGPDRTGDSGTQYFTFAFRRQVVANFDISINSSGIRGLWIAAPGTAIDSASGMNGWLDSSATYAGSGVPGSNTGNGGNGSDGCAFNNSDLIPIDTPITSSYTMTLGEENMSNATGNVVLVRVALFAGQTVSSLSITEANT